MFIQLKLRNQWARRNWQACSIPNVLLFCTTLCCVTLSGKHGCPQGKALVSVWTEILLFGQMGSAGSVSSSSWWHACPLYSRLTSAHFYESVCVFFQTIRLSLSLKVDYRDYYDDTQMDFISQKSWKQSGTAAFVGEQNFTFMLRFH